MSTRRALLVMAFAVLLLAVRPEASASQCGATCRAQGNANGWSRAEVGRCAKACKKEQRKCRGLRGAERAACQDDSATCARECGTAWPQAAQGKDRKYCQFVCGSCGRTDIGFCVEGQLSGSPTARCCGADGGPCCTWLGSPDVADCCATGTTCCAATGCTDTANDAENCGGCGVRCTADEVCDEGVCRTSIPPAAHPCLAEGGEGWTSSEITTQGSYTQTTTYACSPLTCVSSEAGPPDCYRDCTYTFEATGYEPSTSHFRGEAFTKSPIGLPACTATGAIAWLSGTFQINDATIVRASTRCANVTLWTYAPEEFMCCPSPGGFVGREVREGCPS